MQMVDNFFRKLIFVHPIQPGSHELYMWGFSSGGALGQGPEERPSMHSVPQKVALPADVLVKSGLFLCVYRCCLNVNC